MSGVDIESRDKWIVAFVFEHIVIFVVVIFFACVPAEAKVCAIFFSLRFHFSFSLTLFFFNLFSPSPAEAKVCGIIFFFDATSLLFFFCSFPSFFLVRLCPC